MKNTILIASSDYVNNELQGEVGAIPPSFVPVGSSRLYKRQINSIRTSFPDIDISISLPAGYQVPEYDNRILALNNISIIFIPLGLTISQSLDYCLLQNANISKILYGDTLVYDFPLGENVIALASVDDSYKWEIENSTFSEDLVWCGYFSFSKLDIFRKLLSDNSSIIQAILKYKTKVPGVLTPTIKQWFDFGHVNTYFKSRRNITSERSFNVLMVTGNVVRKASKDGGKIAHEIDWFDNAPCELRPYLPQILCRNRNLNNSYYEIEYLPVIPLSELFVFTALSEKQWYSIGTLLGLLIKKLKNCAHGQVDDSDILTEASEHYKYLITTKVEQRLLDYDQKILDIDLYKPLFLNGKKLPSISEIYSELSSIAVKRKQVSSQLHGDLCFSNILYDSRLGLLKLIDPRGNGLKHNFGNQVYDLAKLCHSIVGYYDFIVAGYFDISSKGNHLTFNMHLSEKIITRSKLLELAIENEAGIKISEFYPEMILLFISMVPLHSDSRDRQLGFIANVLRLYLVWNEK